MPALASPRASHSRVARPGLRTVTDAAAYLHIAPGTLRHWVRTRRIEYVRVGRYLRFTQAALDRYVASQTRTSTGRTHVTHVSVVFTGALGGRL